MTSDILYNFIMYKDNITTIKPQYKGTMQMSIKTQCNKDLKSTLDSSPKKALGAHKMAAQLQRRPPWLNTDCYN